MSTARRAKVAAAVEDIREFWRLGRGLTPREKVYGAEVNQTAAAETGLNADTIGKARKFADPANGYTSAEVNDMCRFIRDTQPGQDEKLAVFTRTHVIRLLSVPKRSRGNLQRQAISRGWSTAELERRITALFGSRSAGGRRRRVPIDVLGQLVQVEGMCGTWARWVAAVEERREAQAPRATHPSDFPPRVQRLVDAATAAIGNLRRAVLTEMAGRRAASEPRPRPTEEGAEGPNRRRRRA